MPETDVNLIRLNDDQLFAAYSDFNVLFGYVKEAMKSTHDEKQRDYFEKHSTFKTVLDQINSMAETKFKPRQQ